MQTIQYYFKEQPSSPDNVTLDTPVVLLTDNKSILPNASPDPFLALPIKAN